MKKIAVVAANGRVAQKVVKEAQDRGFKVTGFAREDENKSGAATYIKKDIMELTKDDLSGFDAVVDGSAVVPVELVLLPDAARLRLADTHIAAQFGPVDIDPEPAFLHHALPVQRYTP